MEHAEIISPTKLVDLFEQTAQELGSRFLWADLTEDEQDTAIQFCVSAVELAVEEFLTLYVPYIEIVDEGGDGYYLEEV